MICGRNIVLIESLDYFLGTEYTMARIRKGRRTAVKKMWKRKPRRKTGLVNTLLQPIAQRYIAKVKYAEAITLDTTGATYGVAAYRFNLNSINDPNRTGAGHRPYGVAQLLGTSSTSGLYNRYRVISCSYNIYCSPSTGQKVQLTALPANEQVSSGSSNGSSLRENPRARYVTQQEGAPFKLLRGKVYLPALVGRNKAQYMADDRYQAQWNADPAELALLNVYLTEMSDAPGTGAGAIPVQAKVNIELTYTVEFFDINNQPQSQLV